MASSVMLWDDPTTIHFCLSDDDKPGLSLALRQWSTKCRVAW